MSATFAHWSQANVLGTGGGLGLESGGCEGASILQGSSLVKGSWSLSGFGTRSGRGWSLFQLMRMLEGMDTMPPALLCPNLFHWTHSWT